MNDDERRHPCAHRCTHWRFNDYESKSVGPTIEVCDLCGMSRSHWEWGQSQWMTVDVSGLEVWKPDQPPIAYKRPEPVPWYIWPLLAIVASIVIYCIWRVL